MNCRMKTRFLEGADQPGLGIGSCGRRPSGTQPGQESVDCLGGTPTTRVRCRQRGGPSPKERSWQGECR